MCLFIEYLMDMVMNQVDDSTTTVITSTSTTTTSTEVLYEISSSLMFIGFKICSVNCEIN